MSDQKQPSGEGQPAVAGAAPCSAFQREYLGVPWAPTPEEKRLRELALEYHDRTERFDQAHCLRRNERGIAIPTMPGESAICGRHAKEVRDELGMEAMHLGFTAKRWIEEIQRTVDEWRASYTPNADLSHAAPPAASTAETGATGRRCAPRNG